MVKKKKKNPRVAHWMKQCKPFELWIDAFFSSLFFFISFIFGSAGPDNVMKNVNNYPFTHEPIYPSISTHGSIQLSIQPVCMNERWQHWQLHHSVALGQNKQLKHYFWVNWPFVAFLVSVSSIQAPLSMNFDGFGKRSATCVIGG